MQRGEGRGDHGTESCRTASNASFGENTASEGAVIRLSPQVRAGIQRTTLPALILLPAAIVRTVMVNAGAEDGLARGQAAITGEGLVGRLTEVGSRASRILLITDLNSRIPVVIDGSHSSAVLAGDNSDRPRLVYLATPDAVKVGDRVVTSGEGGIFPPGVPVGVVTTVSSSGRRVEPYVEMSQLGYLMAVDYGLSGALPQPIPPATRPGRRTKTASGE